jgi:hypothetical protein
MEVVGVWTRDASRKRVEAWYNESWDEVLFFFMDAEAWLAEHPDGTLDHMGDLGE